MSYGIQVFNADGTLQFDAGNRLFRTLTSVQTGVTSGSVPIPPNPGGDVVAIVTPQSNSGQAAKPSIAGGSVTWDFDAPAPQRSDGVLLVVAF